MKHVKVKYIESGAFQGWEEDAWDAKIEYGESCVVIKKGDFQFAQKAVKLLSKYKKLEEAGILDQAIPDLLCDLREVWK